MLFPRLLATLFAQDSAFLDYTAWALRIFMATSVVMGIQIACQQTFIAIGNAKTSLFLAIYRKIILLIPLIYILPHFFENKVMAVFLAEPVADVIAVTTTLILFVWQFKKGIAGTAGTMRKGSKSLSLSYGRMYLMEGNYCVSLFFSCKIKY